MNIASSLNRIQQYLISHHRYRRAFFVLYLLILIIFWLINKNQYQIDLLWLGVLGVLIFIPMKGFMRDWWPLILIPFSYRAMYGFTEILNNNVNITNVIHWENSIFNKMPNVALQEWLHLNSSLAWYDYVLTVFYNSFYILPVIAAIWFWFKKRKTFHLFADGFIIMTLAGYTTYVLFPVMPPWLASQEGYLSEIPRLYAQTTQALFGIDLAATYASIKANVVAAIPSLHAAWPFYILLCMMSAYRWKAIWFAVFPLAIWFGIVYLGEHYLVDAIAGIIYASLAFGISLFMRKRQLTKIENNESAG